MSNVDKRVVEMQFNNKQFEKDMATTVKSLKNFEKSLEFKDGNKGLDGFEKRLKNVEKQANNIDFNKLYNSVEQIKNKFSLLGMVAFSTVQKLTQDTINKVTSGLNQIYDTIMVKGEQRALNLEQANFKLMGLLKNEKEVAKVMEDVDYAVSGTAYGLDAAAGVAAQLAASNIKAGDEMKTALRGISGVASMTSSSYEEIGQVFTRVAGQGKVMATDLNSLAARGLNAAAELGKFLGVTESEVRQMVSKGAIDFKTFATAMNEAFGDQAKKANETFTGAMKNVQAALARVGAGFKQPYIKYMRPVLVQLIDNINAVKDAFGPLYDTTSFLFERISHFIITVLEPLVGVRKEGEKQIKTISFLRDIFKNLQELVTNNWERIARLINTVTHLFWKFIDTLKPIANILTFLLKDLFGELMGLSWSLKDTYKKGNFLYRVLDSIKDVLVIVYRWFVTSWPNVKKILSSVFTIIKSIFNLAVKIIKPIKDVLFEIVSFDKVTEVLADLIDAISGIFKAVTEAFNESTESGEALYEAFSFVFSILKVGITIIGKVVSFLAKGIRFLTPYIKILTSIAIKIGDILFQLLKLGFGKAAEGVQFLIDKFKSMEGPLGAVREWFINAKTWIVDKFTKYTTAASDGLNWLKEQLTGSKKEFDSTGDSAENSGNKISEFKDKVKETTSSMVESIKSNQVVQTVWEKVKTFFSYIWTGIKNLVNQVKTNFSKAFEGVTQRGVTPTVFDWLRGAFKSIGQLASDLIEDLGPVKDALLKLTGTDSLMDLIQRIVSVFLSVRMADFFKSFANFHDALANLPKSISDFVNAIRKPFDEINKNFKKRPSSALKNFAASMLMLAASLFIISKIPYKDLDKSLQVLLGLVAMMVSAVVGVNLALKNVNNTYKNILAFSLVIFAFQKTIRNIMLSFAVLMLVVDKVKPATVWRSLAVVGVITILIGAFTILFAKFAKMNVSATQLLAYSLLIKTIGSVIKEIALMIAILSLPIFDSGKLAIASGCIAGITGIIGVLLALFISNGSKFGNTPRQIMAFALLIKAFGSAIKDIAEMIAILSLPIFNPGRLWNSVAIVSVIGILISGLLATMKLVQRNRASQIAAFALFIKVISGSLKGIMILIGILSLFNPGRVWSCVGVIAAIGAIISGLAALASNAGGDGLYKVGKGIMFIGVGILALATAIKTFSKLTPEAILRVTEVITALVAKAPEWIGIIITGFIQAIISLAPTIAESIINVLVSVIEIMTKSASTIVNALMNFFKVLVKEISSFSNAFDIKDLFWAINAVALIAGLIYILQVISSDMKSALKGIALMALVLGSIVGALVILNQFTNVDKTIDLVKGLSMALLSLAGVFAIIGIVTTIMNKIAGPKGTIEALLIGIVGFMLFIIATVAVFGAIGAVINLIGEDAIKAFETSVNVMSKVGQALGSFFGSIVSAFSTIIDNNCLTESMLLAMTPLILALEPLTLALPILTAFIIGIGATVEAIDEYFNGAATKGLENAIQIMPLIGEALGGFMGSLIGAAAKFASKGLAESITVFGDVLSSFMTKIQPFINGLSSISGKTLEQAGQLTLIVLEMCAAELITSITDFFTAFTGKRSLADFAKMLADMAPHLVEFSKSLKEGGFDGELANAAANCALTITNVLNNLPRENGLWQILAGTTIDMDTFGEQLKKFGSSMVEFAASVENITPEQANKIKILLPLVENLVEIANAMPKDGGFWQFLAGTLTDMDEFGEQISKFGISLNDFAKYTSNITIDQANKIKILLPLIESMVDIANAMPKNNGFWQVLAGTLTGFDTFGEQLSKFGVSIDSFAKNTSHISESQISTMNKILPIIESLVDFGNKMAEKGGKWQELFGTKQSLSEFGSNLASLGSGIQQFAAYTALISQNNVTSANGALSVMKQIVDMSVLLQENGGIGGALGWLIGSGDQLKKFTDNLPSIGEALSKFAENTSDIDSAEGTQKVANAIKTVAEAFKMSQESGNIKEFIESINSIANLSVDTIKDGFDKRAQELFDAAEKLVDNMLKGFESKKGSITISLASLMLVVKKTIESNTSAKDGLKTMLDKCVKEISNYTQANDNGDFYRTGKQAVDGLVKGIEDNLYKAVDAGRKIGKSALQGTQFSLDEHSPSKEYGKLAYFGVLGLVNEFAACSDMVFKSGQDLGNSAMNGTKSIIADLDSAINSDMNLQPVISPVLDLSEVSSQAGLIGGMLNAGTSYRIAGATSSLINQNNVNRARTKINQNRSPDVVEAVNALNSRMDSLEQAIINRPIVMDGEKVTKQIAPSMDRALGRRKYYSGRGN